MRNFEIKTEAAGRTSDIISIQLRLDTNCSNSTPVSLFFPERPVHQSSYHECYSQILPQNILVIGVSKTLMHRIQVTKLRS